MNFEKNDTLAIKGIAIIMMCFHHCFLDAKRFEGYIVNFKPFNEEFTIFIASFLKICVGIFVFLTGYGITKLIKNKDSKFNISKKETSKVISNRYISLMSGFIFIFILSQIFCWFMNKRQCVVYKSNNIYNSILYVFIDGFGLSELFNTPTLNSTWWYMSFAIIIIGIIPLLIKIYKKYGIFTITVLCIFVTHAFKIQNSNMVRWIFTLILGIYFADKDLLTKMKGFAIYKRNKYINKTLKFIGGTAILTAVIFLRQTLNNTLLEFKDEVVPVFVVYYCYEFIIDIKGVRKLLIFLGKHSMNVFLIHTFIRHYYFKDFIYSLKYPFLIVTVLLVISVMVSIVIEWLKKLLKYNKLTNFIKDKICYKIDNSETV